MGAAGAWVGAAVLGSYGSCATQATNHDAATTMLLVSARVFCAVLTFLTLCDGKARIVADRVGGLGLSVEGNEVDVEERERYLLRFKWDSARIE